MKLNSTYVTYNKSILNFMIFLTVYFVYFTNFYEWYFSDFLKFYVRGRLFATTTGYYGKYNGDSAFHSNFISEIRTYFRCDTRKSTREIRVAGESDEIYVILVLTQWFHSH